MIGLGSDKNRVSSVNSVISKALSNLHSLSNQDVDEMSKKFNPLHTPSLLSNNSFHPLSPLHIKHYVQSTGKKYRFTLYQVNPFQQENPFTNNKILFSESRKWDAVSVWLKQGDPADCHQ